MPTQPILINLASVAPEPVEYLWPGRIPRGKLTIIGGDPGLGKSSLTLDIAARVTTGRDWPDCGQAAPLGHVLILSAEDDKADTIRPRIDAMGGDPARVSVLDGVRMGDKEHAFTLEHIEALRSAIQSTSAIYVIIDPINAYLGGADSHKDAAVREVLNPLRTLAEETRTAVKLISHLSKAEQRADLYHVSGSIAFTALPRAAYLVAPDPSDRERRLLTTLKFNLGAHPPTLAFRIVDGRLIWDSGTVDITAADLLGASAISPAQIAKSTTKLTEAVEFLEDFLADELRLTTDVEKAARTNQISPATLRRAKEHLGVTVTKVAGGAWACALPTKALNQDAHDEHLAFGGQTRIGTVKTAADGQGAQGAQGEEGVEHLVAVSTPGLRLVTSSAAA